MYSYQRPLKFKKRFQTTTLTMPEPTHNQILKKLPY